MGFPLDVLTPTEWVAAVEADPLALLADHAHCELKAATSAQALIAKNPEHTELCLALSEVAVEEMQHFTRVVEELRDRGGVLGPQDENAYAAGLHRGTAGTRTGLFLDRMLIAHIIEARSLERFHLLAHHLSDPTLAALYRELLPSEAEHQGLYLRHAREILGRDVVDARLAVVRAVEGEVVRTLPFAHTVHSGFETLPAGA